MGDVFDLVLKFLERLLSYPEWVPIERHEILFYCDKLRFRIGRSTWNLKTGWSENMKDVTRFEFSLFTDFVSQDGEGDHISSPPTNETKEDVISDSFNIFKDSVVQKIDQLGNLVTAILEQKNGSTAGQDHGPDLGAMVRNVLSLMCYINRHFYNNKEEYEPNFYSGLSFDKKKFQANIQEICVVFEDGARRSLERFAARLKQLEVIAIGYDHPLCFYIREWVLDSFDIIRNYVVQEIAQLAYLVNAILEQKNESTIGQDHGPPNLSRIGAMVRNVLALLYDINFLFYDNKDEYEPNFISGLSFDEKKFLANIEREILVGFEDEARHLLDQLTATKPIHLQVISIVGMSGLGKTTLARKVYNDPLIVYHFYIRAWVSVSQVYRRRDLLLGILSSVIDVTDQVSGMNANDLAQLLYRGLKGKRYLIVVDDIWNIEAWDDIRKSFPNDSNGSKIMLTTRLNDVAMHAQSDRKPLCLRFLTQEESWDLFQKKAFFIPRLSGTKLSDIVESISRKCQGLPLAIVVIAGLLKYIEIDRWEDDVENISSYVASDPKHYMDTLALSYNHLPPHLKPCFLYLGAFPEDYEIPVRKLIRLWIAEEFICEAGRKSLEDVAEDYLMDLLQRSLIVVAKKGSNGGIKTCRIHDLLRDLCLRIAKEEKFSPKIYRYVKHSYSCAHCLSSTSSSSRPLAINQLELNTDVGYIPSKCSDSPVNALTCSSSQLFDTISKDVSMIWEASELLRALDMSLVQFCIFPSELLQLVRLRYLELRCTYGSPPESISNLTDLETFVISSRRNIIIPQNMWKMVNLRHLCIKSGENLVKHSCFEEVPHLLENLQTISLVSPSRSCEHILARTPNLRKLGLCGPMTSKLGDLNFPDLGLLNHLETLKLLNTAPISGSGGASSSVMFPERLKRLTISSTNLEWKEAWIFEMIPNLEVLKLKIHAFVGKEWETSDGLFRQLKFLKFEELNIVNWSASSNHFPMLQRLVVHRCPNLQEIPPGFGNVSTLEWIELSGCNDTAINSAREIQREDLDNGNNFLKILINPMANSF